MRFLASVFAILAAFFAAPAAAVDEEVWQRAESSHFVIYSAGETDDLENFARELEKFDGLLRFLFAKPDRALADKLEIFLLDNERQVGRLIDSRRVAGYYSPRIEGTHAVAHRKASSGLRDLSGQRILFHEYAHHFMFSEFDKATPAWLIEGFAEFVSTTEFADDGSWTFGKPASHRGRELRYFDDPKVEQLLTWPDGKSERISGFYGWSWALTHMLYTAPDQGARISAYVDRLESGMKPLPAAEAVFGSLASLERDLRNHVRREIEFSVSKAPFPWQAEVTVVPLSREQSRLLELRLRRLGGADLEKVIADLAPLSTQDGLQADALTEMAMARYALEMRTRGDRQKDTPQGSGEAAEEPWFLEAESIVDQALAADPNHVRANVLKGRILLGRLTERAKREDVDPQEWKAARRFLQTANRADPANTEALYRLANSYTAERRENAFMFDAYGAAFLRAPQTREYRLSLAYDFARLGKYEEALGLVQMLVNDPHFPEHGQKAVKQIEMMRQSGAKFAPDLSDDDEPSTQ